MRPQPTALKPIPATMTGGDDRRHATKVTEWARKGSNLRPLACKQGTPERCADLQICRNQPNVAASVERSLFQVLMRCLNASQMPEGQVDLGRSPRHHTLPEVGAPVLLFLPRSTTQVAARSPSRARPKQTVEERDEPAAPTPHPSAINNQSPRRCP